MDIIEPLKRVRFGGLFLWIRRPANHSGREKSIFMPEISRILEFVGPCRLIFVARGGVLYYNDLYILTY